MINKINCNLIELLVLLLIYPKKIPLEILLHSEIKAQDYLESIKHYLLEIIILINSKKN